MKSELLSTIGQTEDKPKFVLKKIFNVDVTDDLIESVQEGTNAQKAPEVGTGGPMNEVTSFFT